MKSLSLLAGRTVHVQMRVKTTIVMNGGKRVNTIIMWLKLFSCSTQLCMKFQQLIKIKTLENKDFSCFQIYHADEF